VRCTASEAELLRDAGIVPTEWILIDVARNISGAIVS
jgi:hypothetical protein